MTWVGNCAQRNPRQMMVINGFAVDARFDWIIADRFPSRWSMGIFSSSSSTTFIEYNQKSSNSHLLTERNNCWSSSSSECNLTDSQRKFIEIVGENCAKRILISTVNDATIRHVCENIIFAKKDDSQLEPDTSANHSDSHANNNSSRSITPVNWIHRPCVTTKTLNKCFTLRMENRARRKKKAPRSGNCWTLSLNDGSPGSIHSGWKRKLYSVRSFVWDFASFHFLFRLRWRNFEGEKHFASSWICLLLNSS